MAKVVRVIIPSKLMWYDYKCQPNDCIRDVLESCQQHLVSPGITGCVTKVCDEIQGVDVRRPAKDLDNLYILSAGCVNVESDCKYRLCT